MPGTAYALLGPTASGKSGLALAAGAKLPLEIVSMDSAQVYRGMDIGTAKPAPAERARVPHHLIDLVDPDQAYSSGRWKDAAVAAIEDILRRQRVPLVVGGTMLYYRALTRGLDTLPGANAQVRNELNEKASREGWPALHAELAKVDEAAARRIAPNDAQRIQRALEVWRVAGKPLSELQGAAQPALPFGMVGFALVPERAELHRRIAARFQAMLRAGLVEELAALRKRYRLDADMPSMRTVGYRQAWEHLEGRLDAAGLEENAVAATRQLAKRQLTWLRGFPELERIAPDADALARRLSQSFL